MKDQPKLKLFLDRLYENRSRLHLLNDPLSFCHRYKGAADREIAGLIASSFAYGNVRQILKSLERLFGEIGTSPRSFVESFEPRSGLRLFSTFKHRFNDGRDLCALLFAIRRMIELKGSINAYFREYYDSCDCEMSSALSAFCSSVLGFDYRPVFGKNAIPADCRFPFFFPSPASGSACKRLCLYLRWMVRPADGIDLGVWAGVAPSRLVIPVDAHVRRIARCLGLTTRKQADWKMALEITGRLRELDSADPVKYDFPIAHIGISEGCGRKHGDHCLNCVIREICGQYAESVRISRTVSSCT